MLFNNLDIISPNITLYFNDKKRHQTPIGGILTLILISITIYIIISEIILKPFPNKYSLILYRNFDIDKTYNYFDKSGLFHFLWIYNEENILNANEIQVNNLKKGIIRIYMTYTYDKYNYNSSNLKDNDHWVYDTCHDYVFEDDLKYDYSFSSCIKYYYNSIDKKYYSIHDNANFKWPYIREEANNLKNNIVFATFVEKCKNDSILNNIFGECYSEERINQYLSYYNNIFISFANNKIEVNNKENKIKKYSHKIYDNIINNKNFFYMHELKFCPFYYEKHNNKHQFMFEGEKATKIKISENNQILLAYIFDFKNYINEFRTTNNYVLACFNKLGGTIVLIYYILYIANYFLNERIQVRNFQMFLNDGNNLIHRHINYEKHKMYNNFLTNISNEGAEQYASFKSTYYGHMIKNDMSNIYSNNNTRINENNYIKNDGKDNQKKTDNVIVINNGTFMNEGNHNNNHKFNLGLGDKIDKIKSLKVMNNNKDFDLLEKHSKAYTTKKTIEKHSEKRLPSFGNNKNGSKTIFNFYSKSKNKIVEDKSQLSERASKQKIADTSSINLLNVINKTKNLYINNSNYNLVQKKDLSIYNNFDKSSELYSPKNIDGHKISQKFKIIPKEKYSQKDFNYMNIPEEKNDLRHSLSKKNRISKEKDKTNNTNIQTNIENNKKRRRKSHQAMNTLRRKNSNDNPNENESYMQKSYVVKKSAKKINQKPSDKNKERHLSLFSRYSNLLNNSKYYNDNRTIQFYPYDNSSQINLPKNLIEHYKRIGPSQKFTGKKLDKDMISQNSKNMKKKNSVKYMNSLKEKENKFAKILQNIRWTNSLFLKYLCLCRENDNNINSLNKFRHKLLSEEYLYILHLNMFMFKQNYGCKSLLEKMNLLEELYNDY